MTPYRVHVASVGPPVCDKQDRFNRERLIEFRECSSRVFRDMILHVSSLLHMLRELENVMLDVDFPLRKRKKEKRETYHTNTKSGSRALSEKRVQDVIEKRQRKHSKELVLTVKDMKDVKEEENNNLQNKIFVLLIEPFKLEWSQYD